MLFIPIYPHKQFESTGAGDAFSSTIVSALALGKTLDEALTWGPINAQSVVQHLNLNEKHTVIRGVHPSPLSAHAGFFGSKPFTAANQALIAAGVSPVDWSLPAAGPSSDDPQ